MKLTCAVSINHLHHLVRWCREGANPQGPKPGEFSPNFSNIKKSAQILALPMIAVSDP
jgi:hypothetical protein